MINSSDIDLQQGTSLAMEDDFGIVYLIESAQQFWSELDEFLRLPQDEAPTLSLLDATLRRFLAFCANYHGTSEQYLQSPLQLEHACSMLVESELFEFHSERMCDIITEDIKKTTDPHSLFIFYEVLYYYGQRRPDFLRSHKRWQPLLPRLMDYILVEIDPDIEDTYAGTVTGRNPNFGAVPIPIEAKLRSLCVKLMYEVCRVVKTPTLQDLKIFDESFIDYLFDLVEQTRDMQDETFNYSVIKLIISLNEQFMVAELEDSKTQTSLGRLETTDPKNRVIRVLMRRLGSAKTFGENMIFMLNRAERTADDTCVKLLILKILYVLFSTKGTSEYFYTNDLCVLVDVFLRELSDLDEDSDLLRHTYLRVLHLLLTKTQLRDVPYKRPQILVTLESFIRNSSIRDVNPETKRLVERCLGGDWCVQLMETRKDMERRVGSPSSSSDSSSTIMSPPGTFSRPSMSSVQLDGNKSMKSLKHSKSVEHLSVKHDIARQPLRSPLDQVRRPSNASVNSLPGYMAQNMGKLSINTSSPKRRSASNTHDSQHNTHHHNPSRSSTLPPEHSPISPPFRSESPPPPVPPIPSDIIITSKGATGTTQRRPPPLPPKRRKPPAIPVGRTNSGAIITSIRSSEPSPLSKTHKPQIGLQQAS
ncbi:hypothetical protein CVT24_012487 [Panaeolus cyanescens]|uniref:SPIN90/Ldb17 leucine-rich domain-containing protein n=1 Tax=Panaeolus cyanescens TaxID=181874 RepID=A0A409YK12_9AGAR|nr:hypothetical protein CVT24_012487 [Panaeolus cyanescens]